MSPLKIVYVRCSGPCPVIPVLEMIRCNVHFSLILPVLYRDDCLINDLQSNEQIKQTLLALISLKMSLSANSSSSPGSPPSPRSSPTPLHRKANIVVNVKSKPRAKLSPTSRCISTAKYRRLANCRRSPLSQGDLWEK